MLLLPHTHTHTHTQGFLQDVESHGDDLDNLEKKSSEFLSCAKVQPQHPTDLCYNNRVLLYLSTLKCLTQTVYM